MPRLVVALVLALGAVAAAPAAQKAGVASLPPREYSLLVPRGTPPDAVLARIRDSLLSALVESRLLPTAFPGAGVAVSKPTSEPGVTTSTCVEPTTASATDGPACIRLGPRSYLALSIVNFPDSRVHLFEVWPIEHGSPARSRDRLNALPRVVVDPPIIADDVKLDFTHRPNLYDVLQRGLLTCGAKVLTVRD
ncbi:MAG: hypothetical protein ACM3NQ_00620 [Bacteroidales bacterium]